MQVRPTLIDEFGNQYQMLTDNIFGGAPVVITSEHHEIHCGDMYHSFWNVDLSNGATDDILIIVPNETGTGQAQKKYHLVIDLTVEAEATYFLYEAPTTTVNGTTLATFNRERNSSFTSGLLLYTGPTVTDTGTRIDGQQLGSGRSTGGEERGQHEWVLKNNTKYLLRVTNATSTPNQISWDLNHYVHPGI